MERCPSCNKRLRKNSDACRRCGWKKRKSIFDFFVTTSNVKIRIKYITKVYITSINKVM